MSAPKFQPGFRLSLVDMLVIVLTVIAAAVLSAMTWWWGAGLAFVVAHFFLFCNVVRMARPLELIWAATFVLLASMTILHGTPGIEATAGVSLLVTVIVVAIELRKPSYHGIAWQTINPNLPAWWQAHVEASRPS